MARTTVSFTGRRRRGADAVAQETALLQPRSQVATTALIDGAVGIVVAPRGRLPLSLHMTMSGERIVTYEVIADPAQLSEHPATAARSAGLASARSRRRSKPRALADNLVP